MTHLASQRQQQNVYQNQSDVRPVTSRQKRLTSAEGQTSIQKNSRKAPGVYDQCKVHSSEQ